MEFWAIVGDANTRKSSSIRALTGAGQRQASWRIRLKGKTEIIAFVEISSPQERPKPLSPRAFVATVKRLTRGRKTTHVVVPLRHDRWGGQPDGLGYIDYFLNVAKWTCLGIAATGINRPAKPFTAYAPKAFRVSVPRLPFDAPNAIARQMRTKWKIE